jgi:hypothetical protein
MSDAVVWTATQAASRSGNRIAGPARHGCHSPAAVADAELSDARFRTPAKTAAGPPDKMGTEVAGV